MGDPSDLPPGNFYVPLVDDTESGQSGVSNKDDFSARDLTLYSLLGLFFVTAMGTGALSYDSHPWFGGFAALVGTVGFIVTLVLLIRYHPKTVHALIASIAALVATWAFLAYVIWTKPKEVIVHNPPTAEDIAKATTPFSAAQEDATSPQQPSPPIGAEISWAARPFFRNFFRQPNGKVISIDPSSIGILDLRATTQGSSAVQLKNGYVISGLTGERRPLRVSTRAGYLDAETYALNEVNPIPPGVQIALYAEWTPPLPVSDFFRQWGKMTIHVDYDDTFWEKTLDENKVRDIIVQDIPNADLVLPVPRVTKKE
jgi:hypothetical protein